MFSKRKSKLSPLLTAAVPPLPLIPHPLSTAMAPKTRKGKGAAKDPRGKEAPKSELVEMRTQCALFPSTVDALTLRDMFMPL